MKTPTKVTKVPRAEASSLEFVPPSRFYFVDAFFNFVFVHRGKREAAQEWVDNVHGKGKYNVRLTKYMQ